jgi:hypothetical protein
VAEKTNAADVLRKAFEEAGKASSLGSDATGVCALTSSERPDVGSREGNPKNAALLKSGTIVAKSKYGQVEIQQKLSGTRYVARKRSGEDLGTRKSMDAAKDLLRAGGPNTRSGFLRPQVVWKHLEELDT